MDALSATIKGEIPGYKPKYEVTYPDRPQGFDLTNILAFRDGQPHGYFHRLREQAPVSWWDMPASTNMAGFWALTKYEDVKSVDLDARTFSSQQGGILMGFSDRDRGPKRLRAAALDSLINLDQPYHVPLRMEHRPFFTPDYIAQLQTRVSAEIDRLLDNVEAKAKANNGRVDLVQNFSQWLPLYTLCEMLGVEEKDRSKIVRWMHYLEMASYIISDPESSVSPLFLVKFLWNIRQMMRYGDRIMADRRRNPRNDLLSVIANAKIGNEPMQQSYLDGSWLLIIFAGNDTTRNSLSGTMRLLTQFPDQKQAILEQPDLVTKLVPEALRLVSPVMYMRRTAKEDAEISGQKISAGEKVIMWYGAANRDPDVFADPDRMDIFRSNAGQHLAFGTGPHVCLGQRVANMQLETAYTKILERFPKIQWTGKHAHAPNNFVHAITELEVDLGL